MIKSKADLEAIKAKVAPLIYLRSPAPRYKVIFHYHPELRSLGIDELVTHTIDQLKSAGRLDCVVLRVYQPIPGPSITLTIVEQERSTKYHQINQAVMDDIINQHLTHGEILTSYLLPEEGNL